MVRLCRSQLSDESGEEKLPSWVDLIRMDLECGHCHHVLWRFSPLAKGENTLALWQSSGPHRKPTLHGGGGVKEPKKKNSIQEAEGHRLTTKTLKGTKRD